MREIVRPDVNLARSQEQIVVDQQPDIIAIADPQRRQTSLSLYRLSANCQPGIEKLVAGACNQRYLQLWSGAA